MELKFIYGEPLAVWKDYLIAADLHIGKRGLPDWNAHSKVIERVMDTEGICKLIIAGDIKHKIGGTDGKVGKFIREIGSKYELHIVKGNHDGGLNKYAQYAKIYGADGAVFDGLGVFHGHAWPSKEVLEQKVAIMGHLHPHACIDDENAGFEKAYIIGELSADKLSKRYKRKFNRNAKIAVMPSFSEPYARGNTCFERLSPVMKRDIFIKTTAQIYLLNGIRIK